MANIPFVSEDFQRAFRNQFPSQTSTGRDLHVSDIVIPIVDFTPTASGASLPLNLRFANNNNVSVVTAESDSTATLVSNTGFFNIYLSLVTEGGNSDISFLFKETTSGSTQSTRTRRNLLPSGGYSSFTDEFVVFIPAGYTLSYSFSKEGSATARADMFFYQIADVNGNLTNPFGYSPQ